MKKILACLLATLMTITCMVGLITPAAAVAPANKSVDECKVNDVATTSKTDISMFVGDTVWIRGWLVPTATTNRLTKVAYSINGGANADIPAESLTFTDVEQGVYDAGHYSGSTTDGYGNFRFQSYLPFASELTAGTYTVNLYMYDMNNVLYDWTTISITVKAVPTGLATPAGLSLDTYTVGTNPPVLTKGTFEQSITASVGSTLSISGWLVPTSGSTPNKLTKLAYSLNDGDTLVDIEGSSAAFSEAEPLPGGYSGGTADGNGNFRISASIPVVATLAIGMHDVEIYVYDVNDKYYKWATFHIDVESTVAERVYIPLGAEKPHNNTAIEGHSGYVTYKVTGAADPFYYIAHNEAYTGTDYRYFVFQYRTTTVSNIKILAETSAGAPTISTNLITDGKWHMAVLDKNTFSVPVNSSTISAGGYRFGFADMPVGASIDVANFSIGNSLYKDIAEDVPVIAAASLNLKSDIGMNWYYYNNDGRTVQLKVTNAMGITFTLGAVAATVNGQQMFKFTYSDIAAKELGDNLCAVIEILADDGSGNTLTVPAGPFDFSPAQYCKDMIAKEDTSAATKTLCADLLNYAAEAQKYFGYETDSLVTTGANLTNATDTIEAPTAQLSCFNSPSNPVTNISNALILNNKIEVLFKFKGTAETAYSVLFMGQDPIQVVSDLNGEFYVALDTLIAEDVNSPINYVVFQGEDQVSGNYTYSISTYIARKWNATASGPLVQAMWKYGCSAYNAL